MLMKLTDSQVIANREQELFESIIADLDWAAIEEIFKKQHNLEIQEEVEYKKGDIVSHDSTVAYRLDFEVKVNLSILIDRQGNFLSVKSGAAALDGGHGDSDQRKEGDAFKDDSEAAGEKDESGYEDILKGMGS
jgi:hypothetical protein